MSRFIRLLSVTLFIFFLFVALAYLKIRREVPRSIEKALGAPVFYKRFRLNLLKGFEFHNLQVDSIFIAETLRVNYSLPSLITRSVNSITIDGFYLNLSRLKNKTARKKQGAESQDTFLLSISHLKFRHGIVSFDSADARTVSIEEIAGFLLIWNRGIDATFGFKTGESQFNNNRIGPIEGKIRLTHDGRFWISRLKSDQLSIKSVTGSYGGGSAFLLAVDARVRNVFLDSLRFTLSIPERKGAISFWGLKAPSISIETGYAEYQMVPDVGFSLKNAVASISEPIDEIIEIPFAQYSSSSQSVYMRFRGYGILNGMGLVKGGRDSLWLGIAADSVFQHGTWFHNVFASVSAIQMKKLLIHELSVDDRNASGYLSGNYDIESQRFEARFTISSLNLSSFNNEVYGHLSGEGTFSLEGKKPVSYQMDWSADSIGYRGKFLFKEVRLSITPESLLVTGGEAEVQGNQLMDFVLYSSLGIDTNRWLFRSQLPDSGEIGIDGSWANGGRSWFFSVSRLDLRYQSVKREGTFPLTVVYMTDSVRARLDTTSLFEGKIAFDLMFNSSSDDVRLDFYADSISLFELQDMGLSPVGSYVTASLELTGTLDSPEIVAEGRFDSILLKPDTSKKMLNRLSESLDGTSLHFKTTYANSVLNLSSVRLGDGTQIELSGFLPVDFSLKPFYFDVSNSQLYLAVSTDSFDVALIRPFLKDFMLVGNGYFTAHTRIQGSIKHPLMDGRMKVFAQDALLTSTNTPLQNLLFDANLRGDSLIASEISARSGENGRVTGKGFMVFGDSVLTNFKFKLDSVPLYPTPEIISIGSGTLSISGKVPNIFIASDIELHEAYINIPFGRGMGGARARPSPIRFRYHIHGARNIFFYNPNVEMELSMNITISKEDEVNVVTVGEFRVLNGKFYYLDRTFDITEGWVRLTGGPELNPEIHLKAEGIVADTVMVNIIVSGTLKHPDIELTSNPPMDKLDIISLIAFGKTMGEMQLEQQDIELLRKRALSFAEGMVSREIRKFLASYGIGISEFMVQADPWSGGYTSFTVGFRPSPNMLFRYSYDPRAVDHFTVQIKYFLSRNIAVYAERERNGEFATGVELEFRW